MVMRTTSRLAVGKKLLQLRLLQLQLQHRHHGQLVHRSFSKKNFQGQMQNGWLHE